MKHEKTAEWLIATSIVAGISFAAWQSNFFAGVFMLTLLLFTAIAMGN